MTMKGSVTMNSRKSLFFSSILSVTVLILTILLTAAPLYAQKEGEATPQPTISPGSDRGVKGWMNLSPEQREKLKKIRKSYEDRQDDINFSMKEKKLELAKLFREAAPDRKKIEGKLNEVIELERARQRLYLDEFFQVREILSPEQVKIFTRQTMRALLRN